MWTALLGSAGATVAKNWKPLVIAVCIAASLYTVSEIIKGIRKNQDLKEYENGRVEVVNPTTGAIDLINPKMVAYSIYDCFYGRAWGMFEDEKEAMKILTSVPPSMVATIAEYYQEIGDKKRNLYEDFRRFLKDKHFNQVVAWLT